MSTSLRIARSHSTAHGTAKSRCFIHVQWIRANVTHLDQPTMFKSKEDNGLARLLPPRNSNIFCKTVGFRILWVLVWTLTLSFTNSVTFGSLTFLLHFLTCKMARLPVYYLYYLLNPFISAGSYEDYIK